MCRKPHALPMKLFVKTMAAATVLLPAVASLAQSNQPLTRAQVTSELVQLEEAGFRPTDWLRYPQNIQEAQARVNVCQCPKNCFVVVVGRCDSAVAPYLTPFISRRAVTTFSSCRLAYSRKRPPA